MKTPRSTSIALVLLLVLLVPSAAAQDAAYGATTFENSGATEAQEPFLRGLLMLHSFEYEDAREAFQQARTIDPGFAMAYWGEAMTYNHPIWMQQDRDAARAALDRLGPTLEERLARAPTQREKDYLRALDVLYGEGDKLARDEAYADAMGRLASAYPEDLDAAAFHALAILGTSHDGRDFATYMRAAAIVEEVFDANPQHPGAAHYLIHSYDDPIHAPLGLRPARVYASIAPAAAHALHMPSHIFVALGMWDDVSASNEDSWAAAEARVERKGLGVEDRGYHALWWLAYSYLQQGRFAEARDLLRVMEDSYAQSASGRTSYHLAAMRNAYLVETRQWDGDVAAIDVDADTLSLESAANAWLVTGLAALKRGDRATAEEALARLEERRSHEDKNGVAEVAELELEALLALDAGEGERAVDLLADAARREDALPLNFGPPSPVKPAHELYGEVLMGLDRPHDAQAQFGKALARAPRRALALLGLAQAADAAGDAQAADRAYAALQSVWHRADTSVPDLDTVRMRAGNAGSR